MLLAQCDAFARAGTPSEKVKAAFKIKGFQQHRLQIPANLPDEFTVEVEHQGQPNLMVLHRHSVRAADYKLIVYANGKYRQVKPSEPKTYLGYMLDEPESIVAASLTDDGLSATVYYAKQTGKKHWSIQPMRQADKSAARSEHIVYDEDDEEPEVGMCGAEEVDMHDHAEPTALEEHGYLDENAAVELQEYSTASMASDEDVPLMEYATGCEAKLAQIGIDAVNSLYVKYGSDLTATQDRIDTIVNSLSIIYLRDAKITYELSGLIVRETPYYDFSGLDGGAILGMFKTEWNSNPPSFTYDLAHMVRSSGVSGVLGVAWVGSMCGYNRYGWSTDTVGVIAHETGHNWGLGHCDGNGDCHIMCAYFGGCNGNPSFFGEPGAKSLMSKNPSCVETITSPASPSVPPRAFNDSFQIASTAILMGNGPFAIDVLANDHDGNCDPLSISAYDATSSKGAVITLSSGTGPDGRDELLYDTLSAAFIGNDTFSYTIDDDNGSQDTAVVTVNITADQFETTTFNFDDGTLQGWTNDTKATENMIAWNTSANNNGGRTVARSGSYMVLEEGFTDRDTDTHVKVLSSPKFLIGATASVQIWTLGGVGGTATPTWTNYANLPTTATAAGFMGAALRRVSDGEYLLFSRRSASGQSDKGTGWLALGWDAAEIAAAVAGDSAAETYVVDIIDSYSGGWGWIGADDATLTDVTVVGNDPIVLNPAPYHGEIGVRTSTYLLDWDVFNAASPTFDVYFGTDPTGQTWLESQTGLTDTQHILATALIPDNNYYWRVDMHDGGNTYTGTMWSFRTEETQLPRFLTHPKDTHAAVGETVQFEVVVEDPLGGVLSYQWYKGVSPDTSTPVGTDSSILSVGPVATADFNTSYYCAVTNAHGPAASEAGMMIEKKLLAHWPLDDINNHNSVVAATPDTAVHGAPTSVSGMIGQAYHFDGVDDYLYVPDSSSYFDEMYKTCTVACWIKTTSTADWSAYVSKYGENPEGWQLRDQGYVGQNQATFTTRGTGNVDGEPTGVVVTDGQWHYVVGTFDSETKNVYVDGLLISSLPVSGPIASTDLPVAIGGRVTGTGYGGTFTGAIDDVRLYNYPMSKLEVAQMYANTTNTVLCVEQPVGDFDGDCDVDMQDFAILAADWLRDNTIYPQ